MIYSDLQSYHSEEEELPQEKKRINASNED